MDENETSLTMSRFLNDCLTCAKLLFTYFKIENETSLLGESAKKIKIFIEGMDTNIFRKILNHHRTKNFSFYFLENFTNSMSIFGK